MKKIIVTLGLVLILLFAIALPNKIINEFAKGKTFDSINDIKNNKVGLVLGTAKYLKDGRLNLYFTFRVNACLELFHHSKIDFVLISGDNSRKDYDEPNDFKNELIKKGIPENKIYLDYAGFRTLDSILRAKKIFGQNKLTIISQKFHNQRAIYLANYFGINAIAYNANAVRGVSSLRIQIREYLARTKVFIDIILGVKPKFMGEKIPIK